MTLKELRDNVLRVLWLEGAGTIPDYIWEDATTAINSALQLMHQSPLDYFRKEQGNLTFAGGETEKDLFALLGANELIGPVWITATGRELHRITDESEFNQFFQRFYGRGSEDSGRASSLVTLVIKPPPTASVGVTVVVAKKADSYDTATVKAWTGSEVTAVPGDAVETILLPLARMYAMRSHFFFEKDKIPMFEQDAARSLQSLQVTDPEMGTKSHMAEQLRKQITVAE